MLDFETSVIKVHEPFAEFLGNPVELIDFEISLRDVARLSGHLCPSVTGAFLLTQKAIEILYPETKVCHRGQIEVFIPGRADEAAFGPMANVISYITGAWSETGFGGFRGEFARRNLLHFSAVAGRDRNFIFVHRESRATATIHFDPTPALQRVKARSPESSFQQSWNANVEEVLNATDVVTCL